MAQLIRAAIVFSIFGSILLLIRLRGMDNEFSLRNLSFKFYGKVPKDIVCPIDNQVVTYVGPKQLTQMWNEKFDLSWLFCPVCGHYFVWPLLSEKNLSDIYSTSYGNQMTIDHVVSRAKSQIEWIQRVGALKHGTGLTVLEQGCAHGALLQEFSDIAKRLICFEPDPDMTVKLVTSGREKLEIKRKIIIEDEDVQDESVDVWLGSHVIEHAPDPVSFVAAARQKMKPGAVFFQEIPYRRNQAEVLKDGVGNFHLNFFNPKSAYNLMASQGFCHLSTVYLDKASNTWETLTAEFLRGSVSRNLRLNCDKFRILYTKCH